MQILTPVSEEIILQKIFVIRDEKVMFDRDLAKLYGVDTKYLKKQVRRNIERFPEDFMFELTRIEFENWRRQFVSSNSNNDFDNSGDKMGLRHPPFVFTEQGVAQLSSVLNSPRAIQVNIQIIRLFTKMRRLLINQKELLLEIEKIKKRITGYDDQIGMIFDYLKQFIHARESPRRKVGFRQKKQ